MIVVLLYINYIAHRSFSYNQQNVKHYGQRHDLAVIVCSTVWLVSVQYHFWCVSISKSCIPCTWNPFGTHLVKDNNSACVTTIIRVRQDKLKRTLSVRRRCRVKVGHSQIVSTIFVSDPWRRTRRTGDSRVSGDSAQGTSVSLDPANFMIKLPLTNKYDMTLGLFYDQADSVFGCSYAFL